MDLRGTADYPGVDGVVAAQYTAGHGAAPGVAVLTVPWQPADRIARDGTLTLSDGANPPVVVRGMRCDSVTARTDGTMTVTLVDRRWRWRFGAISGWYNQLDPYYDPDGLPDGGFRVGQGLGPFVPGTQRVAEALADLCLQAMGERLSTSAPLPDAMPPIDWNGANPAQALQGVLDAVGFRLVYQPCADRVLLAPAGHGAGLPADLPARSADEGLDPPDPPPVACLVGGPNWYADLLPLEPVGLEADGRVRPIDELSYKPAAGWSRYWPGWYTENVVRLGDCDDLTQAAALANQYVYRCFRVRVPAGGLNLADVVKWKPGDAGPVAGAEPFPRGDWDEPDPVVRHRRRVVLGGRVVVPERDAAGQFKTYPAYVVGKSYTSAGFKAARVPDEQLWVRREAVTIDPGRGLVFTGDAMFNLAVPAALAAVAGGASTASNFSVLDPELQLYTSFHLRDAETHQVVGLRYFRRYGQAPDAPKVVDVVARPDVQVVRLRERGGPVAPAAGFLLPATWQEFVSAGVAVIDPERVGTVKTNQLEVGRNADHALDAARTRYQVGRSQTRTLDGIFPIDPDGQAQQVTWSVSSSAPCSTTVSLNTEHAHWLPPFQELRRKERQRDPIFDQLRNARVEMIDPMW